jgi:hypothetical protein
MAPASTFAVLLVLNLFNLVVLQEPHPEPWHPLFFPVQVWQQPQSLCVKVWVTQPE